MSLGLSSNFDEFIASLNSILLPAETESTDANSSFQDSIQNFKTTFVESIDELTNVLIDIKTLPDLSEPNGNGKAFDKFLSIYNNLQGVDAHNHNLTDEISVKA